MAAYIIIIPYHKDCLTHSSMHVEYIEQFRRAISLRITPLLTKKLTQSV